MDHLDLEILEFCVNEEPWHILCGSMYYKFKNPEELVYKVFTLYKQNCISITQSKGIQDRPIDKESFIYYSKNNDWYEEEICPEDAWWDLRTTDTGLQYVKDKFSE